MSATRSTIPRGSWTPSPSPSPPASPVDLSIADADRFRLLETHGPLKPSALGLASAQKGKGKGPLVVVSPEELQEMVRKQEGARKRGKTGEEGGEEDQDDYGEPEPVQEEELALWEEVANAVLWTIPFGFLFSGMCVFPFSSFLPILF